MTLEELKGKCSDMWGNVKDGFWNATDFLFHTETGLCVTGGVAVVGIICFLGIPVHRTYDVDKTRWETEINLYKYSVCHEKQWGSAPSEAYNIQVRSEVHHHRRVKTGSYKDSNGNRHDTYTSIPVYRDRYYYDINRWVDDGEITNYGFDAYPVEAECKWGTEAPNELGNVKRQYGHQEYFEVIVNFEEGKKHTFDLEKSEWEKIVNKSNPTIECKKFRFGSELWDIQVVGINGDVGDRK